ncbi:MAG: hypothetical protein ABUT20_35310 [Bacteroidota bacterium]
MFFDYIFLLKNDDPFSAAMSENNFAIPLNKDTLNHKAKFFEQLYQSPRQFCFAISAPIIRDNEKSMSEEFISFLTTSLFLPTYLKHKLDYLLLLSDDFETGAELDAFKNKLAKELSMQGIKEIVIESVNENQFSKEEPKSSRVCISNIELNNYFVKGDDDSYLEKNINFMVTPELLQKKWVVQVKDEQDYNRKVQLVKNFENKFSVSLPLASTLLKKFNSEENNSTVLLAENEILKFKLQNHADYLRLLRGDASWYMEEHSRLQTQFSNGDSSSNINVNYSHLLSQIEYLESNRKVIIEWYTNEYEILPRWYKRLGHLIKAIMGKRSFKSLIK